MQRSWRPQYGFSLIELSVSLGLVIGLLAVLVPALTSARSLARKEQCQSNLMHLGSALHQYLDGHNGEFPYVAAHPAWQWGGVRFATASGEPFLDTDRPLSSALGPYTIRGDITNIFCCPADRGISGEAAHAGTGHRTVCRAFGTSYRANALLFDARYAGLSHESRGTQRDEIMIAPSRLLVLGDPVWYEVYEQTDRDADWHSSGEGIGNVLFLDGSVRFQGVRPRGRSGPIAIEPTLRVP